MNIEMIGYVAAVLTTVAFVPQVLKIIQSKSAKDVSLLMYTVLFTGVLLWFIYGILLHSFPLILANGVTMGLITIIIALKIRLK